MSDAPIPERYRSKTAEQALAHLAEELAGALQAAAKALRFGITSVNPELPTADQETNIVWLRREMKDIARAYAALGEIAAMDGGLEPGELVRDLATDHFGKVYRHHKGGLYRVLCTATLESDLTPVIVYCADADGSVWVRPSAEFFDGRFKPIDDREAR